MKHLKHLFILLALVCSYTLKAQTKVKYDTSTKSYVSTTTKRVKSPDRQISEEFIDRDSVSHKIYVNSNGRYYVIRKSKKSGKEYKQYLDIQP